MLKDHLGSTRAVLNETNSVVTSYDYMPYGNIMRSSVNTDVTYQFTGQEYDTELSLHNFRARMYDSDLGMFYAMDPAGQGYSPFAYAGNNPIINVDPSGKSFVAALAWVAKAAAYAFAAYNMAQGIENGGFWGGVQAFMHSAPGLIAPGGSSLAGLSEIEYIGVSTALGGATSLAHSGKDFWSGALSGFVSSSLFVGAAYLDGLSAGYNLNESVVADDENLNKFANSFDELSKMQKEAGNPDLLVANSKNIERGLELNNGKLIRTSDGKEIGAYTLPYNTKFKVLENGLVSYPSYITVAPSQFSRGWKLYMTLGHELTHAYQLYSGLAHAWGYHPNNYKNPDIMEWHAYQWNVNTALRWGKEKLINYYINLQLKHNIWK